MQEIINFRDERDWEKFHNIKDLSIGLNIETSELMELFLWKNNDEIDQLILNPEYKQKINEELADILIYSLLISHKLSINLNEIIINKLKINAIKYPINKSKGIAKKYSDLVK